MRVSDLMTRDVVVVEADDTVQRAGELMEAHAVGVLPVYDEGKLVGMVSDRDIAIRLAAAGFAAWSVRVREVMTPGVVTVKPELDEADALELMQHRGVRRLVVVGDEGELRGLLSLDDLREYPEEIAPHPTTHG